MKKILCVCFSPTYQRSVIFDSFGIDRVNRSRRYSLYASGKAVNSARVLNQLEKDCALTVCPLGQENAEEFITLAEQDKLNLSHIFVPGKIRECWTLLDTSAGTTTELVVGETPQTCENADIKMLRLITEKLEDCSALLLSGSRQGLWPDDFYADICGIARDEGKTVLADFTGRNLVSTITRATPDIIKINADEYHATFGEPANKETISLKSSELGNIIVVTRGAESTLAAQKGVFYECPVQKVEVVNTIACGDSFNSGFLYEYLNSNDIQKALEKGTWCAAQNAKSIVPGTILP